MTRVDLSLAFDPVVRKGLWAKLDALDVDLVIDAHTKAAPQISKSHNRASMAGLPIFRKAKQ